MKDITIPRSQVQNIEVTSDKIRIIMNKKTFQEKACKWCGKKFTPQTSHQLYCSEDCTKYARMENTNNRIRKYRKKYEDVQTILDMKNIGTGNLGEHRLDDFKEEYQRVLREMNRQGIKK